MSTLTNYAKEYLSCGLSILRTDGKKNPVGLWKELQKTPLAHEKVAGYMSDERVHGLGIICGAVSGGLEVVDVDTKNALIGPEELFDEIVQAITDLAPDLFPRLVVARTPSGGYHIYYRVGGGVAGNRKLASREATEVEMTQNPNVKVLCFIETRGEGGYVAAAPSEGYTFFQGTAADIPTLTADEHNAVMGAVLSFNEYTPPAYIPAALQPQKGYGKSPLDDYNDRGDVVSLLVSHGWTVIREQGEKVVMKRPGNTDSKTSGDYHRGKGLFSVFTTSTVFEPQKGYRPSAVFAYLECNGDFKAAARKLLDQGYGTKKRAQDRNTEELIRAGKARGMDREGMEEMLMIDGKMKMEDARKTLADYENNSGEDIQTFWKVNPKSLKPEIMHTKLVQFLEAGGFGLYFHGDQRTIFKLIRDERGIIEEISTEGVKKYIQQYVNDLPGTFDDITRDDLLEVIYRSKEAFTPAKYEYLKRLEINFLKDTKDTAYYPFRNGIVVVTKNGVELKGYSEVNKNVWRSSIIDHDIEIAGEDLDPTEIEFYRFMQAVCNDDHDRLLYLMQATGFALHGHKEPSMSFCLVIGEETEDESKGGGTGKGIYFKALGKLIPQLVIDGKSFKGDKAFAFQRVQLDHRLVVIDDVRARIDFEGFYSMITEGFTVEKKNKDEIYISYKDAPKLVFTTNYSLPASADHAKRRQRNIEFAKRFTPGYTPKDMFGHSLFDDWDESEWNRFYNLLFACVQRYLQYGLPAREMSEAAKRKHIKVQYGPEFYDWFEEYFANGCEDPELLYKLHDEFLNASGVDKKFWTVRKFKTRIRESVELFGCEMHDRKNRIESNKVEIWIKKPGAPERSPKAALPLGADFSDATF